MSKMEELSSLTEKLDSVTQQIKSLEKAKTDIELTLEQGAHDYEQTISNLKKEIVNYEKLLKISNSKEQELKAMMDAQDKELAITLEKFQVIWTCTCTCIHLGYDTCYYVKYVIS